jgi:carboxyl-terminal processing protease
VKNRDETLFGSTFTKNDDIATIVTSVKEILVVLYADWSARSLYAYDVMRMRKAITWKVCNFFKVFHRIFSVIAIVILSSSCKKNKKLIEESSQHNFAKANNLISGVIEEIMNNYVNEIERDKLEIEAINGMLSSLDNYSMYIDNDEMAAFSRSARGEFLGIGIEIGQTKGGIEIGSVIDGSPAAIAGLKSSDVIVCIDGRDVSDLGMKNVILKLNSDSNMKIRLTIIRDNFKKFDVVLKKSVIQFWSVKTRFISDIAILRITHFNNCTTDCVLKAVREITSKKSSGVILDLRNNPGGILDQSIKTCNLFLKSKKIVEFKSRKNDVVRSVFADEPDRLDGIPMVVLINRKTASGAELAAAALGENKRAILIGEKTYGKGAVQTVIPIPGHGAIKLTTGFFMSPNGGMIDGVGVIPDIEVTMNAEVSLPQHENETSASFHRNEITRIEPIVQRAIDAIRNISSTPNEKSMVQ